MLKGIPTILQDKAHKRYLLMSIDQRKKMLKKLRETNYNVFEKTCKELGIKYTFPPLYYRKAHLRWVTKKALCIRVRVKLLFWLATALGLWWRQQKGGVVSFSWRHVTGPKNLQWLTDHGEKLG